RDRGTRRPGPELERSRPACSAGPALRARGGGRRRAVAGLGRVELRQRHRALRRQRLVCQGLRPGRQEQEGGRTMKTILATAATAGIALGAPAFAFEPESDQTIKLMQADWTSMLINTEILNIILSTYGY